MRNSTIRQKKKICIRCGKEDYWFSRKRCKACATREDSLARLEEESNEAIKKEGLAELIDIADDWFSKYIRLKYANEEGIVVCYTCDLPMRWQDSQCGHYVKRGNLYLRFDARNVRVQGKCCNEYKGGNYPEYTRRLEQESPGITDILNEEASIVYKPTRNEIQEIITEYRKKTNILLKKINPS